MSTLSQRLAIKKHLEAGNGITPLDALRRFNCFRLGARVWELKRQGMNISKIMVKRGEKRYARYFAA